MALGPFYVAEILDKGAGARGTAMLMRHGETAWNRQGRVMGRSAIDLDDSGRAQVAATAEFIRTIAPDLIVTSPLVRARQSADIVAEALGGGIPVIEEPKIAEVLYGRWEGMTYHELIQDPEYVRYRDEPVTSATPGGETIIQVQARGVEAVMRRLEENRGRRILFVSHGDIIRTVLCHFMGLELHHFRRVRVDNAALSAVQVSGDFAELKFLNLIPDIGRAFASPFPIKKPAA
ncbi:MAG TPA: histidine phosphatase family protein [Candidatus Binataceae bacterium]|nr:histidine phosphatase family protein [Candidatus Binataceae bacterium]